MFSWVVQATLYAVHCHTSLRAMGLCELCLSISSKVLVRGINTIFHHNYNTFKESVLRSKCYICSQVWNSLNEEQKAVASRPNI